MIIPMDNFVFKRKILLIAKAAAAWPKADAIKWREES
jgi:hypothetical protein